MSLKNKAVSGVKWTAMSTVIVALLQLLQLSILSHLLNPSDFGLMALVMVVIGFSQAFLDMGISNAIIHKQAITKNQLSTLYWVNILAGVFLFLIILIIAPFIAEFYKEEELTKLILILSFTFIIQPFGQQFMILWQKEMRFSEIAKIDIITKFINFTVSVFLAYKGYGVYSLVYGTLAGVISQTGQFLYIGLKEYKPSFVFKLGEVKEFLSFGAYQMGEKIINYFNSQVDTILIGKLLGKEALGIYTLAKQIIMRPVQIINPIITKVAFPTMSKVQDDILKLKDIYLRIINHLSSINFPIYAFIFIFANDIVLIMFGEKWLGVVYIMKILSIMGAIISTGNPIGSLILARGKANWGFWWNFGLLFCIPLTIYIGNFWNLVGIAFALVLIKFFLQILGWYFMVKPLCNAQFIDYFRVIFVPAFIAFITGLVVNFIINIINIAWLRLLIGSFLGLIILLILNYLFNKKFLIELKNFK